MGKRKYQKKGKRRPKDVYQVKVPLTQEEKETLANEAYLAMSLLKTAREQLSSKSSHTGYIISKTWLENWKQHVAYDQIIKGEIPSGRKYGRSHPGQINVDICPKNIEEEYHELPVSYKHINLPILSNKQVGKDFFLTTQQTWEFFHSIYGGIPLPKDRESDGEFDFKVVRPSVILMSDTKIELIQSIKESDLNNHLDLLEYKRLQMKGSWKETQMMDFVKEFAMVDDINNLRVWKLESFIPQDKLEKAFMNSIHSGRFAIRGEILHLDQLLNLQVVDFIKDHYSFVIETRDKQEDKFKLTRSDRTGAAESAGICEKCGEQHKLSHYCVCKQSFYCSTTCRYGDQPFHMKFCPKTYDSEDDEALESIQEGQEPKRGRGLVNLGNTCYMNSAIQSLLSSTNLQKFLLKRLYYPDNPENFQLNKRKYMLSFKLEKLLKNLIFVDEDRSFNPISFRSQFAKIHPYFGSNQQQDSAEFLMYLIDSLNDESESISQSQNNQNALVDAEEATQQTKQEESEESSDDDDEESKEEKSKPKEVVQIPIMTYQEYKQKQEQGQNVSDPNIVWNNKIQKLGRIQVDNFLGLLESKILCPICETTTTSYETNLVLPIQITQQKEYGYIDVYVIKYNINEPFIKQKMKFDTKSTMLGELKLELAEALGLQPQFLMSCITTADYISQLNYHEEDHVAEVLKKPLMDADSYPVFFEITCPLQDLTDDHIFSGLELHCKEKRFNSYEEDINFGLPRLFIIDKEKPPSDIIDRVLDLLKDHIQSDDFYAALLPDDVDEEDQDNIDNSIVTDQIKPLLGGISIKIQLKLGGGIKCPFSCGQKYKKEQKEHTCAIPYNKKCKLNEYFKRMNYQSTFISIIVDWDTVQPAPIIKTKFDVQQKSKQSNSGISLVNCIEAFQKQETLQEDNQYFCNTCQDLSLAYKQLRIFKAPNQLIIQLKRFCYDPIKIEFTKVTVKVDYPLQLEIESAEGKHLYILYGVVLHFGRLSNGHYIAYGLRGENWYEFNDEKVSTVKLDEVIGNQDAYLLMYQLVE